MSECMVSKKSRIEILPQETSDNPEPILTIEDIATRLKFKNTSTVYELTRKRNRRPMPAMRVGKVLRFYWSEVERWLLGGDVA